MTWEFNIVERTSCPICQSREFRKVLTHHDDRYGQPDLYDILECQNRKCQLAFLKQCITDNDFEVLYSKYYHHHDVRVLPKRLDYCKQSLRQIRNFIFNIDDLYGKLEYGQRVLDAGCGYGPSVFLERKAIDWVGLELDPKKVSLNLKKGLNCEHGHLKEFAQKSKDKFDVILINQVIEHVSDPIVFFQGIRRLLADEGNAYFSTPNYNSKYRYLHGPLWIHWHVPYHQFYFSINSFSCLAKENGFRVQEIYTRTPFPFFVLQRNIRPCSRGKKNSSLHEKKSVGDLIYFKDIGNFISKKRFDEDCIYAKISLS